MILQMKIPMESGDLQPETDDEAIVDNGDVNNLPAVYTTNIYIMRFRL